jgi:hypothetical protein
MILLFRRLLIRLGKLLPFLFVVILLVGELENLYAIYTDNVVEYECGQYVYVTPISNFISEYIYIDFMIVLMLYVLCVALELCKYTFRCVHVLALNLFVRKDLETYIFDDSILMLFIYMMIILCVFALYGGLVLLYRNYFKTEKNYGK